MNQSIKPYLPVDHLYGKVVEGSILRPPGAWQKQEQGVSGLRLYPVDEADLVVGGGGQVDGVGAETGAVLIRRTYKKA